MRLMPPPLCRAGLAACLAASGFGLAGCGGGEGARLEFSHAAVVLVSVDTLRSDRLPSYGSTRIETPTLSAFEKEAVLFERAYSNYPLTLPSHTSMLSGLLPPQHGVRDNTGYTFAAENHPFLPAELKKAGYATGAFVSAYVLDRAGGLSASFDRYDDAIEIRPDLPLGGLQRPGLETLEHALAWVDQVKGKPFFLFFHIYEPHAPYTPPEPFARQGGDAYDGEVAFADHIVGELFAGLKRRSLYDPSIIFVVSDHGEGLGDHGEQEHGIFLYRESLQVPLFLKLPGGARGGSRVRAPAQLVDVAPTVLSLLGKPVPAGMTGKPLLELADQPEERRIYSETFYPRLHMGWSELASLIAGDFHYIDAPEPELYHLGRDPAERTSLLGEERRVFGTLRDAIRPVKSPLAAPSAVDPETVAKLAALGYTGSPTKVGDGPLPDPKTKIGSLGDLKEGSRLIAEKSYAAALPYIQRTLEANPLLQDAWEKLAICHTHLGQRAAAIAAYQKALESSGGAAHFALTLASLYSDLGRTAQARAHAELALKTAPALGHQRLAEIALAAEDLAEAERQMRLSLAADENRAASLVTMVQILNRTGKLGESATTLARLEQLVSTNAATIPAGLHFVRGDLAARQGRAEEALREFSEEIRRHPESLETYKLMAVVLVTQGQPQEAWSVLQRMVKGNGESPAAFVAAVETLRVLGDPQSAGRLLAHARSLYPQDERLAALAAG